MKSTYDGGGGWEIGMERWFGFVSSVMMMMMMTGHDETIITIYLI